MYNQPVRFVFKIINIVFFYIIIISKQICTQPKKYEIYIWFVKLKWKKLAGKFKYFARVSLFFITLRKT